MRISDWSSDVCSSDLERGHRQVLATERRPPQWTSWTNNQAKLICNSRPLQGLLPALPASSSRSNTPLAGAPDMKTVVIGGSGLIGTKLVSRLREKDHEVVAASPASGDRSEEHTLNSSHKCASRMMHTAGK